MSEILEKESVWLGRFRQPMRLAAIAFTAIAALIWLWLVVNNMLFEDAYGMHDMVRPKGKPLVWLALTVRFHRVSPTPARVPRKSQSVICRQVRPTRDRNRACPR